MRVFGVEISGKEITCIILDGNATDVEIIRPPQTKLQLPTAYATEMENLAELQRIIIQTIATDAIDCIAIVRADKSASVMRVKMECVLELAAHSAGIQCKLTFPQTVAAIGKRITRPECPAVMKVALSNGGGSQPAYLRKALLCAWSIVADDHH